MKSEEYVRQGKETAVLCIHGILGTPEHFDFLLEHIPQSWHVCCVLLDGHGKTADDFARSSMKKWEKQIEEKLDELSKEYENIIIVGHSMGTLLAAECAAKGYDKIRALFLLNVPLVISIKPRAMKNSMTVIFELPVKDGDDLGKASKAAYNIIPDRRLWKYLKWIPRYLELFSKARSTKICLDKIKVPCVVFMSKKDELVSMRSCKCIKKHTHIELNVLENSAHYFYSESDTKAMTDRFEKLCGELELI